MRLLEKYRPRSLNGILGHNQIIEDIKSFIEEWPIPHLLFYGPAGVGKTATALAIRTIINEKIGGYTVDLKELNGSNFRRLDDMRNIAFKIFKTKTIRGKRLVFIDEAGELTTNAQRALKRPLDPDQPYADNFAVIFSTNHIDKLITPIRSRCQKYKFTPLPAKAILKRIAYIVTKEEMDVSKEELYRIAENSHGDMREAIQSLRKTARRQKKKKVITINT